MTDVGKKGKNLSSDGAFILVHAEQPSSFLCLGLAGKAYGSLLSVSFYNA